MLRFENIVKSYAGHTVLSLNRLDIRARQTTALIGPSGCGKSTLIRLAIGLVRPDRGTVHFDGHPIQGAGLRRLRHSMGYVIQEGGLFPHLSAHANVALLARHLGWSEQRVAERIGELRELVQLENSLLQRFPGELSGGQRQRVALMRALMLDPELLLLDEPLGALDPMIRFQLQQELKEIFGQLQKTVLLVTHDLGEAAYFGDRIVLLRAGHIVQQGLLSDLREHPSEPFVTDFLRAQRMPLSEQQDPGQ